MFNVLGPGNGLFSWWYRKRLAGLLLRWMVRKQLVDGEEIPKNDVEPAPQESHLKRRLFGSVELQALRYPAGVVTGRPSGLYGQPEGGSGEVFHGLSEDSRRVGFHQAITSPALGVDHVADSDGLYVVVLGGYDV